MSRNHRSHLFIVLFTLTSVTLRACVCVCVCVHMLLPPRQSTAVALSTALHSVHPSTCLLVSVISLVHNKLNGAHQCSLRSVRGNGASSCLLSDSVSRLEEEGITWRGENKDVIRKPTRLLELASRVFTHEDRSSAVSRLSLLSKRQNVRQKIIYQTKYSAWLHFWVLLSLYFIGALHLQSNSTRNYILIATMTRNQIFPHFLFLLGWWHHRIRRQTIKLLFDIETLNVLYLFFAWLHLFGS